jgi:pimeloyl-ACP methyl ester carboxylesterase
MIADWHGAYSLPANAAPVEMSVQLHGATATVAFGSGHATSTVVPVGRSGTRIRFTFPGGVAFDGTAQRGTLSGGVRQGALRGTFRLRRGASKLLRLLGLYRDGAGDAVTIIEADGFGFWLVELSSGRVHGIGASLAVGRNLGDTHGDGAIATDARGFAWNGTHYARVSLHQREIRVGVDAATLTLPAGSGPFAATAMVHGSGAQTRDEFAVFAAYCESLGVAVLADDKRGVGQSRGTYPGEVASDATIDVLAEDAQREARYLAALPQVDPHRVGLVGDSQAGWIIALAAARERAVRWAVPVVGPTVSVGQSDFWGSLAGQGQRSPSGTPDAMLRQTRAFGSQGFDPRPWLAKLSIPVHWIFGSDDRNVPTVLCIEALEALKPGHDFTWTLLPTTHTPLVLPTGLFSSLGASPGFHPGFFPAIGAWLRSRAIVR